LRRTSWRRILHECENGRKCLCDEWEPAAILLPKALDLLLVLPSDDRSGGFIADNVTYRYYAKSEQEANYLVGVLNTPIVNEAIKPFQPPGLMGERDIHRRPFEACDIPLFDSKNELHRQIAEVSARRALVTAGPYSRPQRRMGGRIPPLVSRFPSTTINESCRVTPRNLPLSN
jgi:hypothetical protein